MEDFEIADAIEAGHNTARTVAIRFGISVSAAAKLVAKFSKKYPQAITTEWRQVKNQAHAQELVYTMKERPCLPTSVTEMEEPSPAAVQVRLRYQDSDRLTETSHSKVRP